MTIKELAKSLLPLLLILAVMAAFLLPQRMQDRAAEKFGEPLFSHALPDGAELIQTDAGKNDDGSIMAAMILKTDLTGEALEAFYSDTDYPPAEEGQTVTLNANALDDSSLSALKQAKLYEEGAAYQFVFLISQ